MRALSAQMARQLAGVKVGDGHGTLFAQISVERLAGTKIGGQQGQVLDDQACGLDAVRLHVLRINTVIADVRIGQSDNLLAIAGVGQDFLVAGHGGVKNHLTHRGTRGPDGITKIDRSVCERQDGRWGISLERQKHWVLRNSYGYAQARRNDA